MQEEELFDAALQCSADELGALLDRECAGRAELRQRIERLLEAHRQSNVLDTPIAATEFVVADARPTPQGSGTVRGNSLTTNWVEEQIGDTIGLFTLERRLGEGGMGSVWVAKQSEPVKRRVALKLIKVGMDSREVLSRFEHERQALAVMDHPNIARVIDAGLTAKGNPYFAMELVNGLPLTQFCDEAKLSTQERLEVFVQICAAVQHAHQKGIIHRDLKPANILVTLIDGKAIPKVIDFGVSKALSGTTLDRTVSTQFGAVIGTLEYMAPEQAGYSGTDVDTRADIYALGVILYELLTGLRPFDSQRLRKAALHEVMRIIREEEPTKPSTRLSTSESLPSLAAARRSDPRKLARSLRGDLDWIALKCLEKDRGRRYETANQLALEIRRFLSDEPVSAGPPSSLYLARKFFRRHQSQVLAAGAVLLAIIISLGLTLWQKNVALAHRVRAEKLKEKVSQQRDRAEGFTRDANHLRRLSEQSTAIAQEGTRQARFALDTVITDIVSRFGQSTKLSDVEVEFLRKLLEQIGALGKLEDDSPESLSRLAENYRRIGELLQRIGAHEDSFDAYLKRKEVVSRLAQAYPDQLEYGVLVGNSLVLATSSLRLVPGKGAEAEQLRIEAQEILEQLLTKQPGNQEIRFWLAGIMIHRGQWLIEQQDLEGAKFQFREAYSRLVSLISEGPADPSQTACVAGQCTALWVELMSNEGNGSEGIALIDRVLPELERLQPTDDQAKANSIEETLQTTLLWLYQTRGRALMETQHDEALEAFGKAIELARTVTSRSQTNTVATRVMISSSHLSSVVLRRQDKLEEAINFLRDAEVLSLQAAASDLHGNRFLIEIDQIQSDLASCYESLGELDQAILSVQRGITFIAQRWSEFPDPGAAHWKVIELHTKSGDLLTSQERFEEAVASYQSALAIIQELAAEEIKSDSTPATSGRLHAKLVPLLIITKQFDLAANELQSAKQSFEQIAESSLRLTTTIELGHTYLRAGDETQRLGQLDAAVVTYQEGIELQEKLVEQGCSDSALFWHLAWCRHNCGNILLRVGKIDEGLKLYKDVFDDTGWENSERVAYRESVCREIDSFAENNRLAGEPELALRLFDFARVEQLQLFEHHPESAAFCMKCAWCDFNRGLALLDLQRIDESSEALRGIEVRLIQLETSFSSAIEERRNLIDALVRAGRAYRDSGRSKESIEWFSAGLVHCESLHRDFPADQFALRQIGSFHGEIANSCLATGEFDQAADSMNEAMKWYESWLSTDSDSADWHQQFDQDTLGLIDLAATANRSNEVLALGRSYQRICEELRSPEISRDPTILSHLGIVLLAKSEGVEAEPLLRETLRIRLQSTPRAWQTFNTKSFLGEALMQQGKYDEARPFLVEGYEGLLARREFLPEEFRYRLPDAARRLLKLAELTGNSDDIEKWKAVVMRLGEG